MKRSMSLLVAGALCFGAAGCEVEVHDAGEPPEVEVREGRSPDADVRGPEVETGEREVTVPTVEDVDLPDDGDQPEPAAD